MTLQDFAWFCGWGCIVVAGYIQFGVPAALVVGGTLLIKLSGELPDATFGTLLAAAIAYIKPGVTK